MLSFSERNDIQRIIYKIKCMKLFRFKDKYRFHKVLKISLCYEFAWFSVRQTLKIIITLFLYITVLYFTIAINKIYRVYRYNWI
jgi:hypothetical protein